MFVLACIIIYLIVRKFAPKVEEDDSGELFY
jgi:hypothetical protein